MYLTQHLINFIDFPLIFAIQFILLLIYYFHYLFPIVESINFKHSIHQYLTLPLLQKFIFGEEQFNQYLLITK